MTTTYLASANHRNGLYRADHAEFQVDTDRSGYFASSRLYGCSKTYNTPEAAIRSLLEDYDCTSIVVHGKAV